MNTSSQVPSQSPCQDLPDQNISTSDFRLSSQLKVLKVKQRAQRINFPLLHLEAEFMSTNVKKEISNPLYTFTSAANSCTSQKFCLHICSQKYYTRARVLACLI